MLTFGKSILQRNVRFFAVDRNAPVHWLNSSHVSILAPHWSDWTYVRTDVKPQGQVHDTVLPLDDRVCPSLCFVGLFEFDDIHSVRNELHVNDLLSRTFLVLFVWLDMHLKHIWDQSSFKINFKSSAMGSHLDLQLCLYTMADLSQQ